MDCFVAENPGIAAAHNEPYPVDDSSDYTIPVHGEQRGIPHVLLEIRNNEIMHEREQKLLGAAPRRCPAPRFKPWKVAIQCRLKRLRAAKSPWRSRSSALLFIDVQNFSVRRDGGEFKELADAEIAEKYGYYFERLRAVIPNMQTAAGGIPVRRHRGPLHDDREPDQGRP